MKTEHLLLLEQDTKQPLDPWWVRDNNGESNGVPDSQQRDHK